MSDRIPLTEKKEYELVIKDKDSRITIRELSVIGNGGSCIVYKGKKSLSSENDSMEDCTVIVKEFYPVGMGISRQDDMSLSITDETLFNEMKDHFAEGQSYHAKFYEYYQDLTLPRMFFYGNANNTVYAVSNPGKGRTLSQINFEMLTLKQIASIMESICAAIRKIHSKKMLYLDCKPDNIFYYGKKSDLQTKVYLFDFDTIISLKDVQSGKNVFCSASFGWIPPEQEIRFVPSIGAKQYRSPHQIGYHTDIYSIGAVFFWLLTKRKPTAEDINSILNHTFDWEQESVYCNGEEQEIIDIIQDITESSLQPDVKIRSKMFRHFISINAVQDQYRNLYGLKAGDDVHFEPIHNAIKRLEEELLSKAEQIIDDVKEVSEKIDNLQSDIAEKEEYKSNIRSLEIINTNIATGNESIISKQEEILGLLKNAIAAHSPLGKKEPRESSNNSIRNELSLPIFNSIIDHPVFGNEREFVRIRKREESQWHRSISLETGKQYTVDIFFRNDSSTKYNTREYDHQGVALRTTIAIDLPKFLTSKYDDKIEVRISAENISLDCVDYIIINTKEKNLQYLHYVSGSCKIINQWKTNNRCLSSNIFRYNRGTLIGLNELNGVILGGDEYSGHVSFTFEVGENNIE